MPDSAYEQITAGWAKSEREKLPESTFRHRPVTGSTNDDVLEFVRSGQGGEFTLAVADYQETGRGRRGDRWEALPGKNLLFSFALKLGENRADWPRVPLITARIVGSAIESIVGGNLKVEAKWPNDLLVDGRKLAGILVETTLTPKPYAVIGVGINVNMRSSELPAELQGIAISLYDVLGCESSRWFLLGLIMREFVGMETNKSINFAEVLEWLSERDYLLGREMRVQTGSIELNGWGAGLGPSGELLLDTERDGRKPIISAEKILLC